MVRHIYYALYLKRKYNSDWLKQQRGLFGLDNQTVKMNFMVRTLGPCGSSYSLIPCSESHKVSFILNLSSDNVAVPVHAYCWYYCCYLFCFVFAYATRHVGSQFPNQGSNAHPLHWELGNLNHQTAREVLFVFFYNANIINIYPTLRRRTQKLLKKTNIPKKVNVNAVFKFNSFS